jgi:pimeloyl-ACP methyl ester carboxylesterase
VNRPVILVPGACLGGWAWHEVAARLRTAGYEVYPVTLTGLGERAHLADPRIDIETHVQDILGTLDFEDLSDALLVGHSYAGPVVTAVAHQRPDRLAGVVYLDTGVLPDGTSIADVQPPELRERQRAEVERHGGGWLWPVPTREALESGVYGSAAGLHDDHFRLIAERGTPHPYATFTSAVRLAGPWPAGVRRIGIMCTEGGLSIGMLRQLVAVEDPLAKLLGAEEWLDPAKWELHELATGHWAMFTMPRRLADLLGAIAKDSQRHVLWVGQPESRGEAAAGEVTGGNPSAAARRSTSCMH